MALYLVVPGSHGGRTPFCITLRLLSDSPQPPSTVSDVADELERWRTYRSSQRLPYLTATVLGGVGVDELQLRTDTGPQVAQVPMALVVGEVSPGSNAHFLGNIISLEKTLHDLAAQLGDYVGCSEVLISYGSESFLLRRSRED